MEYSNSNMSEQQILSMIAGNPAPTTTQEPANAVDPKNPEGSAVIVPETTDSDTEIKLLEAMGKDKGPDKAPAQFFKDYTDLSKKLVEKNLLIPFGTDEAPEYPETEEDFYNGLQQTIGFEAQKGSDAKLTETVEAFAPSLKRIFEYGKQGIQSARELEQFTSAISTSEAIAGLDPQKEPDQRQIVFLQFKNSGMSDEAATKMVDKLAKSEDLADTAASIYPGLRKVYDDEVVAMEQFNLRREQEFQESLNTNYKYAQHFMDNNTQLPFSIPKTETRYRDSIYELAAKPVDIDHNGNPVFAIDRKIAEARHGSTEKDYERYMKYCAFIADPDKYEEKIKTQVGKEKEVQNFNKVINTSGKAVNHNRQEIARK